jgi:O-antigen chain-terminating methyltransferase
MIQKISKTFKRLRLKAKKRNRFADNHSLDDFYLGFENKFRGTESEIESRLIFYAELFKREKLDYNLYPIVDIGCGRGELLRLLKRYSLNAMGIDLNRAMVQRALEQNLLAQQADAIGYFSRKKPGTVGAVIGIHLIEHIPFDELYSLVSEVYTSLTKDGFAIFETPNPENISVSSYSFYMDPSHLQPIPAPLVQYLFEYIGFKDVEILYLHEADQKREHRKDSMLEELSNRMYGPRDYAIVGYKR